MKALRSVLARASALTVAGLFATPLSAADPVSAPPAYKIVGDVPLGPPDHWDYLTFDPVLGRVYVSHAQTVTVVDGASGALIGQINGITGSSHGIVSVNSLGKGFTDDGKTGIALAFDLKTLKITDRIKAEPDADGMAYDAASGHVLVIDGDSGKVTVIDAASDTVVATIDGGGGLESGVSGENGKFYVNGAEKNELVRMDLATNTADAHWPIPQCQSPHGLAIDRVSMRLFVSCENKIMLVINANDGAVVATLPIGEGTDAAAFDTNRHLAFSSNRDGTLSVIAEKSPNEFVALPPVPTEFGARTMAVDSRTGRLYLVTADMIVNPSVPDSDHRHRYSVKPGTVKLLFVDPVSR